MRPPAIPKYTTSAQICLIATFLLQCLVRAFSIQVPHAGFPRVLQLFDLAFSPRPVEYIGLPCAVPYLSHEWFLSVIELADCKGMLFEDLDLQTKPAVMFDENHAQGVLV